MERLNSNPRISKLSLLDPITSETATGEVEYLRFSVDGLYDFILEKVNFESHIFQLSSVHKSLQLGYIDGFDSIDDFITSISDERLLNKYIDGFIEMDNILDNIMINNSLNRSLDNKKRSNNNMKTYKIFGEIYSTDAEHANNVMITKEKENWFFSGRENLVKIAIESGITSIMEGQFSDSRNINSVMIPSSVLSIGAGAFRGCKSLQQISIPHNVQSIGFGAFEECSSLDYIELPESLTEIKNYAFSGCNKLKKIFYNGTEEQWNQISIGAGNEQLKKAQVHFNQPSSTQTTKNQVVSANSLPLMVYSLVKGQISKEDMVGLMFDFDGDNYRILDIEKVKGMSQANALIYSEELGKVYLEKNFGNVPFMLKLNKEVTLNNKMASEVKKSSNFFQ